MSKNSRGTRAGTRSGQAQVEYILLIGVIVLMIIAALFLFRDNVVDFTVRVSDWIGGAEMPQAAGFYPPPSNPPPIPPPPTPAPTATPSPDEELASWLVGRWCAPHGAWTASPSGPGMIHGHQGYYSGRAPHVGQARTVSLGGGRFRNEYTDGSWSEFQRVSNNQFQLLRTQGGVQSITYTRC